MIPLPNNTGVQILWYNPAGFRPKSGEYVKIQCPWLSKGGNEWHPFSVYLKESTELGFKSVHSWFESEDDVNRLFLELGEEEYSMMPFDNEGVTILSLEVYIRKLLNLIDNNNNNATKENQPDMLLSAETLKSRFVAEAREDLRNKYDTTQVFISPLGDWTSGLMEELTNRKQLRGCWVRGPYTSPYFVAPNYSHFVLTATGIGITPALGVMGQYPGSSRTKILVWSTRDKELLKFFAPLMKDAHLAVIFYTGKEKLDTREVISISSFGNIYIQQSRPESLSGTVGSIIVEFENYFHQESVAASIGEVEMVHRAAWCVLYCGGSTRIEDELKEFTMDNKLGFESELFDW